MDQWISTSVKVENGTGRVLVDLTSDGVYDFDFIDARLIDASLHEVSFMANGWWTGHYRYIDSLTISGSVNLPVTQPVLSIAATSADKAEGNSDNTPFTFTVSRTGNTTGTSSVAYLVHPDVASGSVSDFTSGVFPSGTVSFAAGETSKIITINVAGDTTVEPDEPFSVILSNPTGATIAASLYQDGGIDGIIYWHLFDNAVGTIRNDDTIIVDPNAPTVISFSPTDEATAVPVGSNIVVTFSEAIQRGTGNIALRATTAGGATIITPPYNVASSTNISISGNALTIDPSSDLYPGAVYTVEFAAGTIKDLDGNNYAGTTSYNFVTATTAKARL